METKSTFAIAEVKDIGGEHPNGEFEIVMSTDSIDRDGEIIVKGAFDPLPASIPVHAFHDFNDPIGRAVPSYNADGKLVGRGVYASTPRAQEVRTLVAEGVIAHTSVGFMAADREMVEGVPNIKTAELLEVSFVSVPSNRDAAVLLAKSYEARAAEIKGNKSERTQSIHDLAVANGATCSKEHGETDGGKAAPEDAPALEVEEKSTADPVDTDAPGAEETDDGDDLALRAKALSLAALTLP